MNTWKVILATMVIFATGVITGGLLVHHLEARVPHPHRTGPPNRPNPQQAAGVMRLEFLRRAQNELDLTPDQREQIDKLLKDSQEHTRKVMEPILQHTREQFLAVLTPEQRQKFEQLVKEQQQRLREQRQRGTAHERPVENTGPTNAP